jgi:hypothetical protein
MRPSTLTEITGRFLTIRHSFDSSDPSLPPTIIGDIAGVEVDDVAGPAKITIKGPAHPSELARDLEYRFYGRWSTYKHKGSYGRAKGNEKQFHFNSFVRLAPASREAIIGYLKSHGEGYGLGKQRATRLYEIFGSDAVAIARTDPERTARELTKSGLTYRLDKAQQLSHSLAEDHATEPIKLDLTGLVTGRGFPKSIVNLIIQKWGNKAAMIVRRDPYRLLTFPGCGFKRCDAMYLDLGLDPARLKRQALCAWYSLHQNTDGHTWFPWKVIDAYLRANISGTGVKVERAIELAVRAKRLMEVRTAGVVGGIVGNSGDFNQGEGMAMAGFRWFAEYEKAVNEMEILERVMG